MAITASAQVFRYPIDNWNQTCTFSEVCLTPNHLGDDAIPANGPVVDTTVVSPAAGFVKEAQYHQGYGGTVIIEADSSAGKVTILLAHMRWHSGELLVHPGQTVAAGTPVGHIAPKGDNGGNFNPHVHIGIHKGAYASVNLDCNGKIEWIYAGRTDCPIQIFPEWYDPSDFIEAQLSTPAQIPFAAGTYSIRNAGVVGTAFLYDPITQAGTVNQLNVTGPPGWNGNSDLSLFRYQPLGTASHRSLFWNGVTPATGTYTAAGSIGLQNVTASAFFDATLGLATPQITVVSATTSRLTVGWDSSTDAKSFLVILNPIPASTPFVQRVVGGSTRALALTGLALGLGAQYQLLVFATSQDVATPGAFGSTFNISSDSVRFTPTSVTTPESINLSLNITAAGLIPAFSIPCSGSDDGEYYLASVDHVVGGNLVLQRRQCTSGLLSFDSLDLNAFENARNGQYPAWLTYQHLPIYVGVKNTTLNTNGCMLAYQGSGQPLINFSCDANGFNSVVYYLEDNTYPTMAGGPQFTFDGLVWSTVANGNGSINR